MGVFIPCFVFYFSRPYILKILFISTMRFKLGMLPFASEFIKIFFISPILLLHTNLNGGSIIFSLNFLYALVKDE